MAFYYRLLLILEGILLSALGGNFQGKMILLNWLNISEPQFRPFGKQKVRIARISVESEKLISRLVIIWKNFNYGFTILGQILVVREYEKAGL